MCGAERFVDRATRPEGGQKGKPLDRALARVGYVAYGTFMFVMVRYRGIVTEPLNSQFSDSTPA